MVRAREGGLGSKIAEEGVGEGGMGMVMGRRGRVGRGRKGGSMVGGKEGRVGW